MNVLITGAKGFIGKNLVATLETIHDGKDTTYHLSSDLTILPFDVDTDPALLDEYCGCADFIVHLAGVNRPKAQSEFMTGNYGFASELLCKLKAHGSRAPILVTSSVQAELDNPYGQSKKAAEDFIFAYGIESGIDTFIYRLPNVFGKWCHPNYNSAVATFCHNIAHNLPIQVNDHSVKMRLVYVDDVVKEIIQAIEGYANRQGAFCAVEPVYSCTLGHIVELIHSFKTCRNERGIPNMSDELTAKLYATYLSYLPEDNFSYLLEMNVDNRGSFTEFLRTPDRGQVSVNISKPGITKGNHWHHTKNEKFVVVSGMGVIRFRKIGEEKVYEYNVSGDKIEAVDIPTGYTHNIENLGDSDMVTIMWASEPFNPDKPDTFFEEV